jgi:DDE family transposase
VDDARELEPKAARGRQGTRSVKAEWTQGEANPRFVVTSLKATECVARRLYEEVYCARGDMENRIKECQGDLFAGRTSTATMRANQLRLWFASMAYVLICALRRLGLRHTQFAEATCGTIRLKLLKIGAQVRISVRRVKVAMASACPYRQEYALADARLRRRLTAPPRPIANNAGKTSRPPAASRGNHGARSQAADAKAKAKNPNRPPQTGTR